MRWGCSPHLCTARIEPSPRPPHRGQLSSRVPHSCFTARGSSTRTSRLPDRSSSASPARAQQHPRTVRALQTWPRRSPRRPQQYPQPPQSIGNETARRQAPCRQLPPPPPAGQSTDRCASRCSTQTLRQAVMEVEPVTDRLFRLLPEALRDLLQARTTPPMHPCSRPQALIPAVPLPTPPCCCPRVQDRRRQLLYVERQMQRRLVNEFRAQVGRRGWGRCCAYGWGSVYHQAGPHHCLRLSLHPTRSESWSRCCTTAAACEAPPAAALVPHLPPSIRAPPATHTPARARAQGGGVAAGGVHRRERGRGDLH